MICTAGIIIFFSPETERNTVRMMAQNPMSSVGVKRVPRNSEERTVAEAGSRHPISVALTGPIYLTPSRNAENPPAVPISTMIAISADDRFREHHPRRDSGVYGDKPERMLQVFQEKVRPDDIRISEPVSYP